MKRSVYPAFLPLLLATVLLLHACSASKSGETSDKETTQWFEGRGWLNGLQLKPHATINRQEFREQYEANKAGWDKAFAFLKEADLAALKPGKHLIDNENVFVLVTEGPTKEMAKAAWEVHQNYADIHYVVSGKEQIGLATLASATLVTPYDATRDIAFYHVQGQFHEADTGTFFIVFPGEAHAPGMKAAGHDQVKKIVIKIRKA